MKRKNIKMARIIDRAIRLADRGKTDEAAVLCLASNVSLDTALRIITKPKGRRK